MLTLVNASWVAPDGVVVSGSIATPDGILDLLPGDNGLRFPKGSTFDAAGLLVFPGAVDGHVHLREPGQLAKEGIVSGSCAALAGGVTTLLDMPNNRPPCTTGARLEHKRSLFARKCRVNWGLFVQGSNHGISQASRPRCIGAKVYLAKSSSLASLVAPEALQRVFGDFPVVAVHAEHDRTFLSQPGLAHHQARPKFSIQAALDVVEAVLRSLPAERRPRVVICHASSTVEIAWLRRLKGEGFDVWGETCSHYLWLTQDDYGREGARLKVNPPLRAPEDCAALREAIRDGTIDFLSTDHAPHLPAEKAGASPPSGMPGLEWYLPMAWRLVDSGLVDPGRLATLTSAAAARCYRLSGRGSLSSGCRADFVLVRTRRMESWAPTIVTRAAYNPFSSLVPPALEVVGTVVGGRLAYFNGRFLPGPPGMEVTP